MRDRLYLCISCAAAVIGVAVILLTSNKLTLDSANILSVTRATAATLITKEVEIAPGQTYGVLMEEAGIGGSVASAVYHAATEVNYDLASLRAGRVLTLVYDPTSKGLRQLQYDIDGSEQLVVTEKHGEWAAIRKPIAYTVTEKVVTGSISSSLYEAALAAGADERAVIAMAEALQWSVDFALDVRQGDTFSFIYQERMRNGELASPGRVLASKYVNGEKAHYAFGYEVDGKFSHYDQDGNSVQKMFLKAPVAYKYISSGFTTGRRYVKAFNVSTGHRAIDYAAKYGTPIRSVGNGTIVFAGWDGSYGKKVSVRHNGTFTTNYAHMSRIAVKRGQRVSQGQIIGYVGSTGFSTGPHVHYEMVKHGVKVNPLREVLPPGEPLAKENQDAFALLVQKYKSQLGTSS